MLKIWFHIAKTYVKVGLYFYYKKISVIDKNNIPVKGAVIFVANHQNALIDPLLIATTNKRNTHFLTRAGVFKKKLITKILHSFHMIPIYRIRDGRDTISKNEAVFDQCFEILKNREALLIFPEGSHSILRKVRPLKKGFARIIFGALEKYPDLDIHIVPVGMNYKSISKYPDNVTIVYGKPIHANGFLNKNDLSDSMKNILEKVHQQMTLLTTHIDGTAKKYTAIESKLAALNADYQNPNDMNLMVKNIDNFTVQENSLNQKHSKRFLYYLVALNNFIPWIIWKKVKPKIKENEFISTFRYALLISLIPIFNIIQSIIIGFIFTANIGMLYFLGSFFMGLLLTKVSKS